MHSFERILVYASLDDEALLSLEQAAALARTNGASLKLLRVLDDGVRLVWRPRGGDERLRKLLEDVQRELLESRAASLREQGLDVTVEVRWGTPWLEIVTAVLRDGHDLVVKTAEGAARGHGLFFGSTAMHLIRKCPCPVWVVSRPGDATPRRVLAAIDPSGDPARAELGTTVLGLATEMAGDAGELHTGSAWSAFADGLLRNRASQEDLEAYVLSARDESHLSLEKILASAARPVGPEHVHLVKGDPRDVLPELVERLDVDLVVMGSLGRVGIAGLLIGETAESLIRSVRCAVLVVKPPGFECPVRIDAATKEDSR